MGFTAKAGWLCAAHLARDYSEACAMLKGARRQATPRIAVADYQAQLEKRNLA